MKQLRFLYVALLGLFVFSISGIETSKAASVYGLSCYNKAYGLHVTGSSDPAGANSYTTAYASIAMDETNGWSAGSGGTYLGRNCLYAGAGNTNSAVIVAGDIARVAATAIVGGINSRISAAMMQSQDTAAHMSYTSDGTGVGMAANRIFSGLSLWTHATDSDFDNDQTFAAVYKDSNKYDGDSSSLSFGIDKTFGNLLIGLVASSFDTDLSTSVNEGSYEADGETYGIYGALKARALVISAGYGVGDYDFTTKRVDFGTHNTTITASGSHDVTYGHVGVTGNLSRGRLAFAPRLNYKYLELDTGSYYDIVPNDSNTAGPSDNNTTGNDGSGTSENQLVSAWQAESKVVEAGLSISANLGAISPYLDLAYASEDTTSAAYKTEATTDTVSDAAASSADDSYTVGVGVNLRVGGRLTGNISYFEVMDRTDYNEQSVMGSIRLSF